MKTRAKDRFRADPFTDLLFNVLLGFTFLFLVAIMFMNPKARTGIIDPKAEYILTVAWADNNPDDVDVWVEDPEGRLVWFRAPEVGLLHLDRDDRGLVNDTIRIGAEEIQNPMTHAQGRCHGRVCRQPALLRLRDGPAGRCQRQAGQGQPET